MSTRIDIETCSECGDEVSIIPKALAALAGQALASIEDPVVISKILACLDAKAALAGTHFAVGSKFLRNSALDGKN